MAQQNDQPFPELYIRLSEIRCKRPLQNLSDGHPCRVPRIQWIPPGCKNDFETIKQWGWYRYKHGRIGEQNIFGPASPPWNSSELRSTLEDYDTCSMFYSTELNTFLKVPYDCTAKDASEYSSYDEDSWNRLSFGRPETLTHDHPDLWLIGHALDRTQMDTSVYITDSWDSLILPGSFEHGIQRKNTPPTCELAGKLTMILGVVAFATYQDDLVSMIRESFRYPSTSYYVPVWQREPTGNYQKDCGLINKRGFVINVAFDSQKHTKKQIEEWEQGCHGPILSSNPGWNIRPSGQFPNVPIQPANRWYQQPIGGY